MGSDLVFLNIQKSLGSILKFLICLYKYPNFLVTLKLSNTLWVKGFNLDQ